MPRAAELLGDLRARRLGPIEDGGLVALRYRLSTGVTDREAERDEALLGSVVQVALDPSTLGA